ncbi:hemolysin III family protein [Cellulomonas sp. URHD0024]|uniref:PAQR family membrane homeostasis protein TrhA n=1 Tax=Cellulomonas sp. URHD0024 TaxID=1302620 RepID=UPI000426E780|nr:hemolysin III family protein [Cellulomonas sp. URHD0024]
MSTSPAPASGPSEAGPEAASSLTEAVAAQLKPHLRGWIHLGVTPLVVVASIVLVALSPTPTAKWSCAVFGLTAIMLFGTSALYHRGNWSPTTAVVLRRLDHTNIFLIIAGTYTPLSVLLLPTSTARVLLIVVWTGALAGVLARVFWLGAPRWFYVPVYVALGWVAVWFFPSFYRAGGPWIVFWIALGGLAYTLGAAVYGTKWPNPSPRWFGFHEVFHVLTVVGYGSHYIAVSMASYSS